jgi:hypothetical protein
LEKDKERKEKGRLLKGKVKKRAVGGKEERRRG